MALILRLELRHRIYGYSRFSKPLPYRLGLDQHFWLSFKVSNLGLPVQSRMRYRFTKAQFWRRAQDSNLQTVSGQMLSRHLPHLPDTRRIWSLQTELNRPPSAYRADVLPSELCKHLGDKQRCRSPHGIPVPSVFETALRAV